MRKVKTHRQPCGCTHDGARWIDLCAGHQAEHAGTHARWAAERLNNQVRKAPADERALT